MPGFRLLRRAREDVLEIGAFTAERWGEAQAERYIVGLFLGFQTLVERPELRRNRGLGLGVERSCHAVHS